MTQGSRTGLMLAIIAVVLLALFVGAQMVNSNRQDDSSRLSRAADELSDGVENASEELRDRSAGEKVGDAIEDTGDAIKDAARSN